MKIAFITGITGQDGSYLAELLLEKNYKVYGFVRRTSLLYSNKRIEHIRSKLTLKYGDMTDGAGLSNYIMSILTEHYGTDTIFEIYNLAAQSHVKISFEIPEYTSMVDGIGTLKLLEIIRSLPKEIQKKIRFYQAGTSEMFGEVLEKPQKETTPFNPQSPYACAKVYAHHIVKNYRESYDLFACNGILFNHESPRRAKNFVTMKIINCIKEIQEGKIEYMELGNINSLRDWGHSKDYVYGMWLMLQQDTPDDYVLASGKTISVREFIEKCFEYIGDKISWEGEGLNEVGKDKNGIIRVKINEKYFRPSEVEYLLGDSSKAERVLKWKREYDLERLINDMFENII